MANSNNTPTCPKCNIKMIYREGKKGKSDFFGCPNFPQCRHTEQLNSKQKGKLLLTKIILAFGSVGLSIFLVFQVIGWMGNRMQDKNKEVMEKNKIMLEKAKQEAENREHIK